MTFEEENKKYEQEEKKFLSNFVKELIQVCAKHKISLGGCGCCGSPYFDSDVNRIGGTELNIKLEKDKYVGTFNYFSEMKNKDVKITIKGE